ncbi:MAG TPA: DUF4215 domain-containing protein [Polyangiaceae bacterium LLY-WYZ-15_(1-7)]|nr:hypothetical protein [Sandaracinus sp.]MBJ70770.1 hypothetical protein [Sandaracinus sp.]HJL01920.1 DUF4215 domain-containing protein [Polyangiaceae bacterium LLY-WYZ-15_(1-7)]HJL09547.1 DUF4215 domain-containing protein [Polyangiaceae bacterium LLY-WYZ-15_(1-7)]HJL30263.1 DUF4215 domain-containing protein [Polyangiaceae bacterium LLY-WYZ-15_(1-7)]
MPRHICFPLLLSLLTALAACGEDGNLCGELVEDESCGCCVCPMGTTPVDGVSCALADGGVITAPEGAPVMERDGGAPPMDAGTDAGRDGGRDAGTDGGVDAGPCAGAERGAACGSGLICLDGACAPSICGDGFVDPMRDEQCEDGNDVPGDGCEPSSCTFSCEDAGDCDDGNACDGAESCGEDHVCVEGEPLDAGAECTRSGGEPGVCNAELCVAPGCGNGVPDEGEECDDGADGDDLDGCRDDCTFTCETAAECDDDDACNGVESCDLATHTCRNGSPLDCNDGDNCTEDSCDPSFGCRNPLIDEDDDGFAPARLGTCSTMPGSSRDCDDGDDSTYPGAPEQCDDISHDCDARVDEDLATLRCYRDADEDGWPDIMDWVEACACPDGFIPERADSQWDCADNVPLVNPGYDGDFQEFGYLDPGARLSWDYDCDGTEEPELPNECTREGDSCTGGTWPDGQPPCGEAGRRCGCLLTSFGGSSGCLATLCGDFSPVNRCR